MFKKIGLRLAKIEGAKNHTATSFAIGVLIGFSPFLGLHTAIALTLCLLSRVNKAAIILGTMTNLPWIVPPYYAFSIWLGALLLGTPLGTFPASGGLKDFFSSELPAWTGAGWSLLIPAVLGSSIMAVVLAFIAYRVSLSFLTRLETYSLKQRIPSGPKVGDL